MLWMIKTINNSIKAIANKISITTFIFITTGMSLGKLATLQWKFMYIDKLENIIGYPNSYIRETVIVVEDANNTRSKRICFSKSLATLFEQHKKISY